LIKLCTQNVLIVGRWTSLLST